MKVRVKEDQIGYYEHARRRPGDVFELQNEPRRKVREKDEYVYGEVVKTDGEVAKVVKKHLRADDAETLAIASKDGTIPVLWSSRWMEAVDVKTAEKITTAPEALKEFHDKTVVERAQARSSGGGSGNKEVI